MAMTRKIGLVASNLVAGTTHVCQGEDEPSQFATCAPDSLSPDAHSHSHVQVPLLSPAQLSMLLNADPLWVRPALDRHYDTWREESGKLADGRHYKHYFLVDSRHSSSSSAGGGAHHVVERLAVVAQDSQRRDRYGRSGSCSSQTNPRCAPLHARVHCCPARSRPDGI